MSDPITTRKCSNPDCGEWYDARSSSCYFCGAEEREVNIALKKSIETSRLNGALSSQMQAVGREEAAGRALDAARADKTGQAFGRVRPRVPGYGDLVQGIKDGLEEHPGALREITGRD